MDTAANPNPGEKSGPKSGVSTDTKSWIHRYKQVLRLHEHLWLDTSTPEGENAVVKATVQAIRQVYEDGDGLEPLPKDIDQVSGSSYQSDVMLITLFFRVFVLGLSIMPLLKPPQRRTIQARARRIRRGRRRRRGKRNIQSARLSPIYIRTWLRQPPKNYPTMRCQALWTT